MLGLHKLWLFAQRQMDLSTKHVHYCPKYIFYLSKNKVVFRKNLIYTLIKVYWNDLYLEYVLMSRDLILLNNWR